MIDRYHFDDVDEDEHRFGRDSNFFVAVCVALLPLCINILWRTYEGAGKVVEGTVKTSFYEAGITDLAFAGVVVAISVFTNTHLSIKLSGWKSVSRWTFGTFLCVVLSALLSFVAYLQAAHDHIDKNLMGHVFWATFTLVLANIVLSYVAQYCFLSDEFRNARTRMQTLPPKFKRDILT